MSQNILNVSKKRHEILFMGYFLKNIRWRGEKGGGNLTKRPLSQIKLSDLFKAL